MQNSGRIFADVETGAMHYRRRSQRINRVAQESLGFIESVFRLNDSVEGSFEGGTGVAVHVKPGSRFDPRARHLRRCL